ncbi:MAG: sugar ABC transporter substrate-binding protein [Nocardioidaceae bacterium]
MRWKTRHALTAALAAGSLVLSGCSSEGGAQSEADPTNVGPRLEVAMVTHAAPGDTFWDIVRKGAEAAAAKDNVELLYSSDPQAGEQAQLIEAAIDQNVDGIVVSLAKPEALAGVVRQATQQGIPVVSINSGDTESAALGAIAHFGQNETIAGRAAGEKLNDLGYQHALCVNHEQGNVGLEERCAGAKETFDGQMQTLFVNGEDTAQVQSSITAQLQTSDSIDAVLALGAPFALTAVDAVEDAGSKADVATFDMDSELINALKAEEVKFAVDQQPYLQGYLAVDEIWLWHRNGNIVGGGQPVLTGPNIVTPDEAGQVEEFAEKGTR